MDSDTSSLLILVAIIAAAILVPLILIGTVVLIFLPVVRRRRQQWQTTAASLGLQSDPMCMYGFRGLPVRIFWNIEGQRTGQLDWEGAALLGRHDMRGGRAGLRYTYCRALLEPPLHLGLNLTPLYKAALSVTSIPTGHSAFDAAFMLDANESSQAQTLLSLVANEFALVAQNGWKLSATDQHVQVRLGGDYNSQFPERDPVVLSTALDTIVHCGQRLLEARRTLPPADWEQNVIAAWEGIAPGLGLSVDRTQTMLAGAYAGLRIQVYLDLVQRQEWRTVFSVKSPEPLAANLSLTRKGAVNRNWLLRGRQVVEQVALSDPIIEQTFEVSAKQAAIVAQALNPQARQCLQRLCKEATDVLIEDGLFEASLPGVLGDAGKLREVLDAITGLASAMTANASAANQFLRQTAH